MITRLAEYGYSTPRKRRFIVEKRRGWRKPLRFERQTVVQSTLSQIHTAQSQIVTEYSRLVTQPSQIDT
jgi:hypothetical protein